MATFPPLRPATRQYSMGIYPVTTETGFGGGSVRFSHGATPSAHTLQLGFVHLKPAASKLIRDHYRAQQGGFLPFSLSLEAWAGHTTPTDLVPVTTLWVYAQPPEETHKPGGLVDVTVQLQSVIYGTA